MQKLLPAILFAAATLGAALGVAQGLISEDIGMTLILVFPALAVTSLRGNARCCASRGWFQ